MQPKVLLYYKFVSVPDPETVRLWQRELCTRLNLHGRIIVSEHGINGTLGGDLRSCKHYVREMNVHHLFRGTDYKWSEGRGGDFPERLSVKVRKELVTLAPDEEFDVFDSGTALDPQGWHELLEQNPDITILDARNTYESEIGRFRGAITPEIGAFKEIKPILAELDPDKPVATYCTGDVRCEYLSAYMKHLGFKDVYHLDGGIVTYGKQYRDRGLWEGKCYVFDKRKHVQFAVGTEDIAKCLVCGAASSEQIECSAAMCDRQLVVCQSCQSAGDAVRCVSCVEAVSPRETQSTQPSSTA